MTEGSSTALDWFKSSYSGNEGGECLEAALTPTAAHVRDSKQDDSGPVINFAPASWSLFLERGLR